MTAIDRRVRATAVLHREDVLDDETLHPGSLVWLGEAPLRPEELARYRAHATRARSTSSGLPAAGASG